MAETRVQTTANGLIRPLSFPAFNFLAIAHPLPVELAGWLSEAIMKAFTALGSIA